MKKIDLPFLIPILILILLGISICLIGSYNLGIKYYNDGYFFYNNHLISIGIGFIVFFIGLYINVEKLFFNYIGFWAILCILLLVVVLIPGIGKATLGSRRWIKLGVLSFQASEVSKILILFVLSFILHQKREEKTHFFQGSIPPVVFLFANIFLIILEPDLSTALIFLAIGLSILFVYRTPLSHLLFILTSTLPFLILFLQAKSYAFKRLVFFDPLMDPYGKGYHLFQAFLSFKRGGIFGNDTSEVLAHMNFFPDAYTDFSFSLIGQQFGILGCLIILLLYMFVFYRGIKIVQKINNERLYLLGFGIIATLIFETTFHLLVNVGLIPTTGLPLPFISYGKTALVAKCFLIGVLLNIAANGEDNTSINNNKWGGSNKPILWLK